MIVDHSKESEQIEHAQKLGLSAAICDDHFRISAFPIPLSVSVFRFSFPFQLSVSVFRFIRFHLPDELCVHRGEEEEEGHNKDKYNKKLLNKLRK